MTTQYTTTAHTNVQFIVTKSICNANGYLLPHILFNRIKTIASYPVKELYSGPIPDISDYTFKMKKNACIKDKITVQAQLLKKHPEKFTVNVWVTKKKKDSKVQETLASALLTFSLSEKNTSYPLVS